MRTGRHLSVKAKNNPHFSHFPHPGIDFQTVTDRPMGKNPHWNPHVTHTWGAAVVYVGVRCGVQCGFQFQTA